LYDWEIAGVTSAEIVDLVMNFEIFGSVVEPSASETVVDP